MKLKYKNFNLIFLIFINISIFLEYQLFVFTLVLLFTFLIYKNKPLENLEYFFLKIIPINYFINAFLNTFNNNQMSSIFWDMQNFLHYIKCNTIEESYIYNLDLIEKECPTTIGYGPLTDLIYLNIQNIWIATLIFFISFSLFLIYILFKSKKNILIVVATLISPGMHFLIFSLNSDIFVIVYLYLLMFLNKKKFVILNFLILSAITQIKVFTVMVFLGFALVFYFQKELKETLISLLFFVGNSILLFNHLFLNENIIPTPISFTRSFGIIHDFRILYEYIGFDEFSILISFIILILILLKKYWLSIIADSQINLNQDVKNNLLLLLPTLFLINFYQNWGYKFVINSIFIILVFQQLNKRLKIFVTLVTLTSSTYYLIGWGFEESILNYILIITSKLSFYTFFMFLILISISIFNQIKFENSNNS